MKTLPQQLGEFRTKDATTPSIADFQLRLAFVVFYDDLERFLASRIGAGEPIQASDIVQETYARAFHSIGTFSGKDDKDFHRWLIVIAKNALTDARRKHHGERRNSTEACPVP